MNKFRVAYHTPSAYGKLTNQMLQILKAAIQANHWKIAVIVYGKEYQDGYKAGLAEATRRRDSLVFDEGAHTERYGRSPWMERLPIVKEFNDLNKKWLRRRDR